MKNLILAVASVITLFSFAPAEASAHDYFRVHRSSHSNGTAYPTNAIHYSSGNHSIYQQRPSYSHRGGYSTPKKYHSSRSGYYNYGYRSSCGRR